MMRTHVLYLSKNLMIYIKQNINLYEKETDKQEFHILHVIYI